MAERKQPTPEMINAAESVAKLLSDIVLPELPQPPSVGQPEMPSEGFPLHPTPEVGKQGEPGTAGEPGPPGAPGEPTKPKRQRRLPRYDADRVHDITSRYSDIVQKAYTSSSKEPSVSIPDQQETRAPSLVDPGSVGQPTQQPPTLSEAMHAFHAARRNYADTAEKASEKAPDLSTYMQAFHAARRSHADVTAQAGEQAEPSPVDSEVVTTLANSIVKAVDASVSATVGSPQPSTASIESPQQLTNQALVGGVQAAAKAPEVEPPEIKPLRNLPKGMGIGGVPFIVPPSVVPPNQPTEAPQTAHNQPEPPKVASTLTSGAEAAAGAPSLSEYMRQYHEAVRGMPDIERGPVLSEAMQAFHAARRSHADVAPVDAGSIGGVQAAAKAPEVEPRTAWPRGMNPNIPFTPVGRIDPSGDTSEEVAKKKFDLFRGEGAYERHLEELRQATESAAPETPSLSPLVPTGQEQESAVTPGEQEEPEEPQRESAVAKLRREMQEMATQSAQSAQPEAAATSKPASLFGSLGEAARGFTKGFGQKFGELNPDMAGKGFLRSAFEGTVQTLGNINPHIASFAKMFPSGEQPGKKATAGETEEEREFRQREAQAAYRGAQNYAVRPTEQAAEQPTPLPSMNPSSEALPALQEPAPAMPQMMELSNAVTQPQRDQDERTTRRPQVNIDGMIKTLEQVGSKQGGGLEGLGGGAAKGVGAAGEGASAGGIEAIAGGGEAAGAVAGAEAGSAAGPWGAIVGAAVAAFVTKVAEVTKAFIELPSKMEKFGDSVLDSQRYLDKYNAGIAIALGQMELADTMRNIKVGQGTEATTVALAQNMTKLKDSMVPQTEGLANLTNGLASLGAVLGEAVAWFTGPLFNLLGILGKGMTVLAKVIGDGIKSMQEAFSRFVAASPALTAFLDQLKGIEKALDDMLPKTTGEFPFERFLNQAADRATGAGGRGLRRPWGLPS